MNNFLYNYLKNTFLFNYVNKKKEQPVKAALLIY